MNKKELAITLSKLKAFQRPSAVLEQYQTDPSIAAELVWFAYMQGDVKNKVIADLGCGNGILGISCLLLGAKQVYFVDLDNTALLITKQNLESLRLKNAILLRQDVLEFSKKVDTVIQNPPFGVQTPHADAPFLKKAIEVSNKIYSFHKLESKEFIQNLIQQTNFKIKDIIKFSFVLPKTQEFHKKPKKTIDTGCWIIAKQ